MIPTDTHMELLRQLPIEVQEKLRAHGPGWVLIEPNDNPSFWRLNAGDPVAWDEDHPPWLPCNPSTVLWVAIDVASPGDDCRRWGCIDHNFPGSEAHIQVWRNELGDAGPRDVLLVDELRQGDDVHEAALRVLLAVCGGEE